MSNFNDDSSSWYILKVIPGREDSVSREIRESVGVGEDMPIKDVSAPAETSYKLRGGQKKVAVQKKLLPGYVLVRIAKEGLSGAAAKLKGVKNVLDIMGGVDNPSVIPESQLEGVMRTSAASSSSASEAESYDYMVGGHVKIVDGVFQGFEAAISEVDTKNERLNVTVSIFDRETPLTLSFKQVTPVYNG